jgi:hypothetical protein
MRRCVPIADIRPPPPEMTLDWEQLVPPNQKVQENQFL